ncbi:MAG TPA: hypothetical protein VHZ33_11750 [Trebonia sp.]|jgi:hypothetical protein|nr:hypothetical protein [Trebonia sp.]
MKMKWIAVAVASSALLAGCSLAPLQASALADNSNAVSPTALPPGSIGSNGPVVGVNLYAISNYTAAQTTTFGTRTLAYIKSTLNASAVDLVWSMYVPSYSSDSVVTTKDTLTPANIGILTKIAQRDGLTVEYRPLLFVQTSGNNWEGLLKPKNPTAWFNSYYERNLPYLKLAKKDHISEYVIGTEMKALSPAKQWPSFLARSAKVFKQISYAQNQYVYFRPHTDLPPTKLTGVDMYEPLNLPADAPLAKVEAAYDKFFASMPASILRRSAIQETGIEARAGAYQDPPNLTLPGKLDQEIQYNWFTAGCAAVKRFHLRGIFFWKVDLADNPLTHPASSLSTWEGKEGAVAISDCEKILKG